MDPRKGKMRTEGAPINIPGVGLSSAAVQVKVERDTTGEGSLKTIKSLGKSQSIRIFNHTIILFKKMIKK
jgi:hypothetical protein